jgi:hypothetical protein
MHALCGCARRVRCGRITLQAQFDTGKTLSLKEPRASVDQPACLFRFDVKDEAGKVRSGAETVGPAALRQAGFLRGPASFRVGETYTFEGFTSKTAVENLHVGYSPPTAGIQIWFGDERPVRRTETE